MKSNLSCFEFFIIHKKIECLGYRTTTLKSLVTLAVET